MMKNWKKVGIINQSSNVKLHNNYFIDSQQCSKTFWDENKVGKKTVSSVMVKIKEKCYLGRGLAPRSSRANAAISRDLGFS